MTESKIMKSYYDYMRSSEKLKVGTYELRQLSEVCGISATVLVFLGARANADQAPVALKNGWYIYTLEERILEGETKYYLFIDNSLKYL